ncbi:MAG: PfkB family carbohydrate kinase [bacterium]|nr:PfkB family carbohydrate kinase [bacterium]
MGILVVGSVALDTVETPFGRVEEVLGGSAIYFSVSASFFTDVRLVAVVGDDFSDKHIQTLKKRGIDLQGLEKKPGSTFRWTGKYGFNLSDAQTQFLGLNVFADFSPRIPEAYRETPFLFLANIQPSLQLEVLKQLKRPDIVAADTMNCWIAEKRKDLLELLKRVDILTINESEARQLSEEYNLVKAARRIQAMGPKILVIKQGEYGVLMFEGDQIFSAPGYPLETVYDPTGAGDTFAGGFMGYLVNTRNFGSENLRRAIVFGSVMASFNVEDFSLNRLVKLTYPEIEERYHQFKRLSHFEGI